MTKSRPLPGAQRLRGPGARSSPHPGRFAGGFYGQLVSGVPWLASASLATWSTPRAAITTLLLGGFFIFPITELLIRVVGGTSPLSAQNSLRYLGMQVAFV